MRHMILSLVVAVVFAAGGYGSSRPTDERKTEKVGLNEYVLVKGPVQLEKGAYNASGVTFNPDTNTLFVVLNSTCWVVEVDLEGKTKRVIPLEFFADTEGIAYMGNGLYAVTEERRRIVCLIRIESDTKEVKREDAMEMLVEQGSGNNGLEGIAFDADKNMMYVVKEYAPRRIYRFPRPDGKKAPTVKQPWDIEKESLGMDDVAGIHFHADTGHLLIVSEASVCVVECTTKGEEISRLDMSGGSAGMREGTPQAEGVTMDNKGRLYVVSEPNLLYVFEKKGEVSR